MNKKIETDIGNNCVECNQDTSFGTGLFMDRCSASADWESWFEGKKVFEEHHLRVGYLCSMCQWIRCQRCDRKIYYVIEDYIDADLFISHLDESVYLKIINEKSYKSPKGVLHVSQTFKDGSWEVCPECLTEDEQKICSENNL